jgi:hypothetical protein
MVIRLTLAALALAAALPALAVGRIADINIIDRDSGETLKVYRHRGEHWVAGRPGARYAVSVRNSDNGRIMGVVSVDGVNVVSGQTAAWNQTGYVLGAWQSYDITGWRKSDAEVAAFHFTPSPASYAARTGRPGQVGVIGVALFREKPTPPPVALPEPYSAAPDAERHESAKAGRSAAAQDSAAGAAERRFAPASPAPSLGTGHGEREAAWVGRTTFERRSVRPDELIRIRYDSRENLIAMGIIAPEHVPSRPDPFPDSDYRRYAPDPQ